MRWFVVLAIVGSALSPWRAAGQAGTMPAQTAPQTAPATAPAPPPVPQTLPATLPATQTAPATESAPPSPPPPAPGDSWMDITHNIGGDKWGYAGITALVAVPDSDRIIAGVSEQGLWTSGDGGESWTRLGAADKVQITNRPYQIIFDPKDPRHFWESGNNGPGLFVTADAGKTFSRIGDVTDVDGLGIDFTDPARQTIVIGHHERERSTEKSTDGGKTWQRIGLKLPEKTNFSNDVIVLDGKTFIVNSAGWKQGLSFGIYRTADGGDSWTKVSDFGPDGPALVLSGGMIYWQALWNAGLLQSIDAGKTWAKLPGPVRGANPIAMDGKLLAPVDKQLYVSADAGKTWQKFGDELPFKPTGIAYNAKTRSIYAYRSTESKEEDAIERWNVPGK
jgi:photosystem II stability/assembly factor-like uncharacterized protein